jgi:dolichyl-phosphate-mannose--protein O-mannosyl transferase
MATDLETAATDDAPSVPAPRSPRADGDPPRRSRAALLLPVVLLLVAGTVRFTGLGHPQRTYFDEVYYAHDAEQYLTRGVEEGFVVHPPVGKWLIAAGIALLGDVDDRGRPLPIQDDDEELLPVAQDAASWRFASAVAGTLNVLVLYLAGVRLFRRRGIAALGALLLAVDGLAFTMSRIAMLDVFLSLFITTGFWLLLVDRDQQWAGTRTAAAVVAGGGALPRRPHPYRWLAGVAFGLALGTKWSALLAIAAAGVFVLVSELTWRQELTGRALVRPLRIVASGLATLVAVPLLVYVLSYAGWFASYEGTRPGAEDCPGGDCAGVSVVEMGRGWLDEQEAIARFHGSLQAEHPYRASPWTWFLMTRPVAYYFESCDDPANPPANGCVTAQGNVEEILGIGNPLVWWLALLAHPVLIYFAVWRRDWRAGAILGFLLAQTLPWFVAVRPIFLFYMTPAVPFLCLSLAYACGRAATRESTRWVPAVVAIATVAAFLFFLPVLTGAEIPRASWDLRIWIPSWV